MNNSIPEKTKLKGIHGFATFKKSENVEQTGERIQNRKFQTTTQSARFF